MITLPELSAFLQVVLIDITLAGDNAIVVGMAAGGLARAERNRAIMVGIVVATVLRIVLAVVAARALEVLGLTLAGGFLLLWVAWKMLRETLGEDAAGEAGGRAAPRRTVRQAMVRIVLADLSMSLDNVLAVAGTARNHIWVLVAGLALSVALMGLASTFVARLMRRMPAIIWLGLGIITYVACSMIYDGWRQVAGHI